MNEKFSELYHRAWTLAEFDDEYKEKPTYERRCVVQSKIFAELIVQECLDTIQRGIDNGGGANEDIVTAGKLALFYAYRNIQYRFGMGDYKDKEHFGVEE